MSERKRTAPLELKKTKIKKAPKKRETEEIDEKEHQSTLRPNSRKQPATKEPKPRTKHKLIPEIGSGMALVFIRHACDAKDHTDIKHAHDAPLCSKESHQKQDISNLVKLLVTKSNNREPSIIYTSPFQRCVDTAKKLAKYLETSPDIVIDCRVSRLFTTLEQDNPQISKKTRSRDPPIVETDEEFEQRLRSFTRDTYKSIKRKKPRIVWCITHALVLKHIFSTPNEHMSPLDVKVLDPKTCKYFQKKNK